MQTGGQNPTVKSKRLAIVVFNQNFVHKTGVEKIVSGNAFSSFGEFVSSVFSFRGFQFILFLLMVAGIFFGNSLCKELNEETHGKLARLELAHNSTYIDLIENGTLHEAPPFDPTPHLTMKESLCIG